MVAGTVDHEDSHSDDDADGDFSFIDGLQHPHFHRFDDRVPGPARRQPLTQGTEAKVRRLTGLDHEGIVRRISEVLGRGKSAE